MAAGVEGVGRLEGEEDVVTREGGRGGITVAEMFWAGLVTDGKQRSFQSIINQSLELGDLKLRH